MTSHKFIKEILKKSESKILEKALDEWEYNAYEEQTNDTCECGKTIHKTNTLINTITGYYITVGTDCINKFCKDTPIYNEMMTAIKEYKQKKKDEQIFEKLKQKSFVIKGEEITIEKMIKNKDHKLIKWLLTNHIYFRKTTLKVIRERQILAIVLKNLLLKQGLTLLSVL